MAAPLSSDTKRKLLVFQTSQLCDDLYQQLMSRDWEIYVAKSIPQAFKLQEKHGFKLGLCLVDKKCRSSSCVAGKTCLLDHSKSSAELSQLNHLFNSNLDIRWIMGLPHECHPLQNPGSSESKLIAEHCYNYVTLPIDIQRLQIILGNAYGMSDLIQPAEEQFKEYPERFGIVGDSPVMKNLFSWVEKVNKEECCVLVQGETGTGKELIANAIHYSSTRSKAPIVAINCGAFPKDLIQAELFGYEKGAFTGAIQGKVGCIEAANGGTLFLDEIGDLPLNQQVNLLRVMEDKTITRLGSNIKKPVNVRIIAATHVDLKEAVKNGEFREDLYYRLRVLQITMPPLRERENDIELLANYFLSHFSANRSYKAKRLHPDALYLLKHYHWPGNIRELKNCIQHALVMSDNYQVTPNDLGLENQIKSELPLTLEEARADTEERLILKCLELTNNNMSRTAKLLGISRVSLYRLVEKYNIAKPND